MVSDIIILSNCIDIYWACNIAHLSNRKAFRNSIGNKAITLFENLIHAKINKNAVNMHKNRNINAFSYINI